MNSNTNTQYHSSSPNGEVRRGLPNQGSSPNGEVRRGLPRGIRNNNPLNIRRNPANKWQGQRPVQTDPAFVQFLSDEWGFRAAAVILRNYRRKGICTVRQIISRWAPPSENRTARYISTVCQKTGFQPDTVIEGRVKEGLLLRAMALVETGRLYPLEVIERGLQLL